MLKAIETLYNGYRFRSRLEARWAVFFDTLGIEYEYEKEGYDLDGVWYLPDFWLPKYKHWVEVKGQNASVEEKQKCSLLARYSTNAVLLLCGNIPLPPQDKPVMYRFRSLSDEGELYMWTECLRCKLLHLTEDGLTSSLFCNCNVQSDPIRDMVIALFRTGRQMSVTLPPMGRRKKNIWETGYDSPRLIAAYTAARQARFEHGEKGYVNRPINNN